jgi:hypothetical protein
MFSGVRAVDQSLRPTLPVQCDRHPTPIPEVGTTISLAALSWVAERSSSLDSGAPERAVERRAISDRERGAGVFFSRFPASQPKGGGISKQLMKMTRANPL